MGTQRQPRHAANATKWQQRTFGNFKEAGSNTEEAQRQVSGSPRKEGKRVV